MSTTYTGPDEATALAAANEALAPLEGKTVATIVPAAVKEVTAMDGTPYFVCGVTVTFTDGTKLAPWAVDTDDRPTVLAFG